MKFDYDWILTNRYTIGIASICFRKLSTFSVFCFEPEMVYDINEHLNNSSMMHYCLIYRNHLFSISAVEGKERVN